MKFISSTLWILLSGLAMAEEPSEWVTYQYPEQGFYIQISPGRPHVDEPFIVLKRIRDNKQLDIAYRPTYTGSYECKVRDITGDGIGEIFVYGMGGGLDMKTYYLTIYTVMWRNQFVEAAGFDLSEWVGNPLGGFDATLYDGRQVHMNWMDKRSRGAINFPSDGVILYSYASAQRVEENLTLDFKVDEHHFNPETGEFDLYTRNREGNADE